MTANQAETAEPAAEAAAGASTVEKAKQRIKEEAVSLKGQAAEKARGYAVQGKEKATGTLHEVSAALTEAAGSVDQHLGESYGEYGRLAASAVAGFADRIEAKDVEELIQDAEDFVRRSPVLAIGIAAVAGFAIARLIKSGLDQQGDA